MKDAAKRWWEIFVTAGHEYKVGTMSFNHYLFVFEMCLMERLSNCLATKIILLPGVRDLSISITFYLCELCCSFVIFYITVQRMLLIYCCIFKGQCYTETRDWKKVKNIFVKNSAWHSIWSLTICPIYRAVYKSKWI